MWTLKLGSLSQVSPKPLCIYPLVNGREIRKQAGEYICKWSGGKVPSSTEKSKATQSSNTILKSDPLVST